MKNMNVKLGEKWLLDDKKIVVRWKKWWQLSLCCWKRQKLDGEYAFYTEKNLTVGAVLDEKNEC